MKSINRHILTGGKLSEIDDNLNLNYFTIEALEDGLTASLSINNCDYCIDNDNNWQKLNANESTTAINKGQTILFKGNIIPDSTNGIGKFTISKKCNIKGNPLSLIYSDDFKYYISTTYPNNAFKGLFDSCTKIVDASYLELTGIANSEQCFSGLFKGCTSLVSAPNLPSMSVGKYSYQNLFKGCTSLTTAPELPAITLAYGSYAGMFEGCTNLVKAPTVLPAIDLTGCTYCYQWMFYECRKLTEAPIILAEKLEEYCCRYMFMYCTSLVKAPPMLSGTTKTYCYHNMFHDCTSLLVSPILSATTLSTLCYMSMFKNCSKLKEITMLATDISASNCLSSWVSNVASSGTFIKHPNMTSLPQGINGIPSGWTVIDYTE